MNFQREALEAWNAYDGEGAAMAPSATKAPAFRSCAAPLKRGTSVGVV